MLLLKWVKVISLLKWFNLSSLLKSDDMVASGTPSAQYENLEEVLTNENAPANDFPFKTRLSFDPFLDYLKKRLPIAPNSEKVVLELIKDRYAKLESEYGPFDKENANNYMSFFEDLVPGFLPALSKQQQIGYFAKPFSNIPVFTSAGFDELMTDDNVEISFNIDQETISNRLISNACTNILSVHYGQDYQPIIPAIVSIREVDTQLETHFRLNVIIDFSRPKPIKPLLPLSAEEIRELILNMDDIELWLKKIPVENFEFEGFTFIYLEEATEEEVMSKLKNELLQRRIGNPVHSFNFLHQQIRSFFGNPNLCLGVTSYSNGFTKMLYDLYGYSTSILDTDMFDYKPQHVKGSVYELADNENRPIIVEDIEKWPTPTKVEKKLIEEGCKSIILIPLADEHGENQDFLELVSTQLNDFNFYTLNKLQKLLPLFSAGFENQKNYIVGSVMTVIQEQFTNIHPSVVWKFRDVSMMYIQKSEDPDIQNVKIDPIIFDNVYPLYGQADIVKSSLNRNRAIQKDLIDNLQLLGETLSKVSSYAHTHLMDYFRVKVHTVQEELTKSFSPSDETRVLELLRTEIHPCLRRIIEESQSKEKHLLHAYFAKLNPVLEVIYNRRKDFEQSVGIINDSISRLLNDENDQMQSMLPHYFEKYKTDGVEFNIYLGQSLLEDREFTEYHLKNFRLWQLICMCRITQKVAELQDELPHPLTTAQLIFVYSDPLDIRFRMEEKHFDVDGAYNVRYEIIKKRIDKAYVQGTDERLTQSGKIAIVYLHRKDRLEYLEYLAYLVQIGLITDDIEHLRLGKLQGVEGLKALRVTAKV